jgi:hypothetical protein
MASFEPHRKAMAPPTEGVSLGPKSIHSLIKGGGSAEEVKYSLEFSGEKEWYWLLTPVFCNKV